MEPFSYIEKLYYRDIGRFPVLNEEQEISYVKGVQQNDKKAMNDLILGNLRFVVSIARKYQNRGLSLLELINEGNIGLYKAAKRFNLDKQVKFTSYAVWWVRQCMQKALFDQATTVKIPPNKLTLIRKFRRALGQNDGDFYKTMALSEFKDYENEIIDILEKLTPLSLDAPVQDDGSDESTHTLLDILGVEPEQEEALERSELRGVLDGILADMTQREEAVLRMYYGIDYDKEFTLEEIGNKLKLTRERVRQIKNKALRKLFKNKELRDQVKIPLEKKSS
ncbi:MAG: RNA polymerase sigma factor RpoD/SigA [Fibrobacterota bacterium]